MSRFQGSAGGLTQVVLAQLFLNACVTGMRMAAPLQSLRLGHGEVAVGCLIALFALSQMLLALPAGRYCERHGLKRPILMSAVVAVVAVVAVAACAVAAAWPVFLVLCVSALLMGGSGGVAIIAVQRHAPRIVSEPVALRQAFSWLAIGLALSNVLGPLATGFMIDGAGYRAAFLGLASLPLLAWLAVRGVVEHAAHDHEPAASAGAAAPLRRSGGNAGDRKQRVQPRHSHGLGCGGIADRGGRRVLGRRCDGGCGRAAHASSEGALKRS